MLFEGDIGVYGIAVLIFFFKRYFGNFDFNVRYNIAVSSSPEVCGFSPFRLTVFGKRRSFAALRYRSFALNTKCHAKQCKIYRLINDS